MSTLVRLAVLAVALSAKSPAGPCSEIPAPDVARLERYVAQKYRIPEGDHIRLAEQSVSNSACYHKLVFKGQGPLGEIRLILYVTADARFLSEQLIDSYLDPRAERRQEATEQMVRLQTGEFASKGPPDAPLTLVEFSDFECPFCRSMHTILKAEPLLSSGRVRLIYRHMPLPQHVWAQAAAEAAACAQFQTSTAFWALHDAFFEHQSAITKENIRDQINSFAAGIPAIDKSKLVECMDRQMSFGAVIRDQQIGENAGVDGTPTLFLNGERLPPISSASELHRILESAMNRY